MLDKFIIKYVLCNKCKYPEVAYVEQGKKDLLAICNACGAQRKLDTMHKAGKQLLKEMPTFYAANPEFKGKQSAKTKALGAMADEA